MPISRLSYPSFSFPTGRNRTAQSKGTRTLICGSGSSFAQRDLQRMSRCGSVNYPSARQVLRMPVAGKGGGERQTQHFNTTSFYLFAALVAIGRPGRGYRRGALGHPYPRIDSGGAALISGHTIPAHIIDLISRSIQPAIKTILQSAHDNNWDFAASELETCIVAVRRLGEAHPPSTESLLRR